MTGSYFHRFWLIPMMLLAPSPAVADPVSPPQSVPSFIPAKFGTPIPDSMGFQWDITLNGMIQSGTNRCFSGAGVLEVGGSSFSPSQRQMSPDGKEFVLSGSRSGINITRRVRVDVKTATARFVETFQNPQTTPVNLVVKIATSLRSSVGTVMTDSGKVVCAQGNYRIIGTTSSSANVPVLGEKECGLLTLRTSSNYPAILFFLAAPKSEIKPTFQRNGSTNFSFYYHVSVPPKKSVSIVHGMAQRKISGIPNAKTLAGHFKPFLSREWTRDLPLEVRRTILNSGRSHYLDDAPRSPLLQPVLNLADHWDVERGKSDLLVQGEETRMLGTIAGSSLSVETGFGETTVPLDQVAAFIGGGGVGRAMRVYLRNGEILFGTVKTAGIELKSESGLKISLVPKQVNTLFMHTGETDGKPSAKAVAILKTHRGDQLAMADSPLKFHAATAWGPIEVPLKEIDYLFPIREPQPIHRLILRDKSRLSVILDGSELELATLRFGSVKMSPGAIARLASVKSAEAKADNGDIEEEEEEELKEPHCRLLGNNLLVGTVDGNQLELRTSAGVVSLDTRKFRLMERLDEDEESADPAFTVQLTDGTQLEGRLRDGVFPFRALEKVWHVPAYHVLSFRRPEQKKPEPVEKTDSEEKEKNEPDKKPVDGNQADKPSIQPEPDPFAPPVQKPRDPFGPSGQKPPSATDPIGPDPFGP